MIRTLDFCVVVTVCVMFAAAGCGGSSASPTPPSAQLTVSSVAVAGTAALTAAGQTGQLTATATLSDGTTQNVTSSATWQSSNQSAITVSSSGLATAIAAGSATITAATQSKSGTLAMTVTVASTTSFIGTIAGGSGQSATFLVTVETGITSFVASGMSRPLAVAPASGTLTLIKGGGSSTLIGTFDTAANRLNLSGGGYVLTGAIGQGAVSGTFTGPNNSTGKFAGLDSTRDSVTLLCGTWSESGGDTGTWNLQVSSSSGAASGVTNRVLLTGRLNGTALTLTSSEGVTATGTVQGGVVSGSYAPNGGGQGTFTGSSNGCR